MLKNKLIKFLVLALFLQIVLGSIPAEAATTYTASWASVDNHNPAPEWFQDAKFGIYFHWGAFSVPAFCDEWYPRWMYNKDRNEYKNQVAKYGDPYSNWPYHNFINGAYDKTGKWTQFAPKLKSQGGNFDPDEWAQLFADAGAKFAGNVAEHHDGFSMWDSEVNEWNSVDKGPKLDLSALFEKSIRAKDMKYLMSMHHAFNLYNFYQWTPVQSDTSLKKLYGQLGKTAEEQLWYDKLKEIIDKYQPDIIWQDFYLGQISESQRLKFLSYYYNKAIDLNKEVVATFKDGFNTKGEVQDYERGGPANITYPYWLTDDSISSSSWCYTQGIGYYSAKSILHALVDRVSKNGNMLLNIAPMADGTIPQGQKDILLSMGNWLKKYGEAIYSTRAWNTFGEGPTKMGGDGMSKPKEGTAQDIRFTRNKANNALYAIGMAWPSNNQMVITSLKSGSFDTSKISSITFLNGGGSCIWTQDSTGLKVNLPSNLSDNMGYAIKISLSGSGLNGVTFYQDYNYAGSAVTLSPGNYTMSQLTAAGVANNSASSIKVPEGFKVEVYNDDNFGGTKWTFTSDNANFGAAGCNDAMTSVKIIDTTPTLNATFYLDYNYAGTAVSLAPGNYTMSQLTATGIANNSVSSIKVPEGLQVEIYNDDNFGGTKWTVTADSANFGDIGCNDAMTSVKISKIPLGVICGDLNGDKNVDSTDYALMKMYLLGSISEFPVQDGIAADLNGDGVVDAIDFAVFKKYLLGDISKLPYSS